MDIVYLMYKIFAPSEMLYLGSTNQVKCWPHGMIISCQQFHNIMCEIQFGVLATLWEEFLSNHLIWPPLTPHLLTSPHPPPPNSLTCLMPWVLTPWLPSSSWSPNPWSHAPLTLLVTWFLWPVPLNPNELTALTFVTMAILITFTSDPLTQK